MFKKIFRSTIFLLAFGLLVSPAGAAETVISITGNGGSSQNTVEVKAVSSITVQQSNDAKITNKVSTDSNTGGNQALSNTGDTNIQTGSISNTSNINNQNINTNVAENKGCGCNTNTIVAISGNGSNSVSNINLSLTNSVNISQENSAQITNNSTTNANTGNNQANNNNGGITIKTGNITSLTAILNKNINHNFDPQGNNSDPVQISINGNGNGSTNSIVLFFGNSLNYISNNFADIKNNAIQNLNTGNNTANNNNGAVLIATGNIVSVITIGNENINGSFFNPPPTQIIPPPGGGNPPVGGENPPGAQPPTSGSNPSGGSGSSVGGPGQVLGAAIGNILPATGAYWILLMTILAITMFLAGGFLRFGSDPSPPFAYAV